MAPNWLYINFDVIHIDMTSIKFVLTHFDNIMNENLLRNLEYYSLTFVLYSKFVYKSVIYIYDAY